MPSLCFVIYKAPTFIFSFNPEYPCEVSTCLFFCEEIKSGKNLRVFFKTQKLVTGRAELEYLASDSEVLLIWLVHYLFFITVAATDHILNLFNC